MKYIISIILLFYSYFGYSNNWERVKYSGTLTNSIISDSNSIYCFTEGGFYRKQKNDYWKAINNNSILQLLGISSFSQFTNNTDVSLMVINNKLFLYNTNNNKLIKSSDAGLTWTNILLPNVLRPMHFFVHNGQLYLQSDVDFSIVYHYKNELWSKLTTPKNIGKLSSLGNKILNTQNTNELDNGFSIGDSLFNFIDYTTIGLPILSYHIISYYDTLFFYNIGSVYSANNINYVISNDSKIYRSKNNERWQECNNGLPSNIITINNITNISDTLFLDFVSNQVEVYFSLDSGNTWQQNSTNILPRLKFNREYYALHQGKLFKSNLNNNQWRLDIDSIYASSIYHLQTIKEFIFFQDYTISRPVRFNTKTDKFEVVYGIDLHNNKIYSIIDSNKINLFLSADYNLYHSVDTGMTWNIVQLTPFISKIHNILSSNSNEIIFKASDINDKLLILTLDELLQIKNIGENVSDVDKVTGLIRVNNKLYLNYYNVLKVYSSNDNGQTWEIDNSGIESGTDAYELFSIDSQILLYVGNANSIRTIFYIKKDNQWEKYTSNGITISSGMVLDFDYSNNTLYTSIPFTKKMYYSTDLGRNWNIIDLNGLSNSFISSSRGITTNEQSIYIGSWSNGLYKRDAYGKTTSVQNTIKTTFNAYPNPVKNNLYIDINYRNNFSYEILDLNSKLYTSGALTDKINFNELPKGYYVLKLVSGNETISKIIIKE